MTKRFSFVLLNLLLILILAVTNAGAEPGNSLTARYLNGASNEYAARNNEKAFTYINYVLEQYSDEDIPDNVTLLAEAIYFDFLGDIKQAENIDLFREFQGRLSDFPYLASDRLKRQVRSVTDMFVAKAEKEEAEMRARVAAENGGGSVEVVKSTVSAIQEANDALFKRIEESQMQHNEAMKQQMEHNDRLVNTMVEGMRESADQNAKQTHNIVLILSCIAVFFVLIIVVVIILSVKMAHRQQELFTTTMRVVSELQRIPYEQSDKLRLEDIYSGMRAIEDANSAYDESRKRPALEEFDVKEVDDELRAELRELATECERQGAKIDRVTSRKNNSKNVSELVFKIAQHMELGEYMSMLYFCAAMVYDIGFLAIDPELFEQEKLSEEQKYEIRGHVRKGVELLDFVPEKFRPVFVEAVLMHHENMDGSGYPDGLTEGQISKVARIIHVVESFIAQISRRNYKGIFDKETAISELRNSPEKYDPEIVAVLDGLI